MGDCEDCARGIEDACPESERDCGHHCECSWLFDSCCWCDKEWGCDGCQEDSC